jgi:HK97 family phage portal protein
VAFWDIFRKKESRTNVAIVLNALSYRRLSDQEIMVRGYKEVPYIHAGINLIARAIANLDYQIVDDSGSPVEGTQLEKLWKNPNPFEAQSAFLKAVVISLLISGNAFIEIVRAGNRIIELYNLNPLRMVVKAGERKGIVDSYEYRAGAQTVVFDPSEIIHIKLFNPFDDFLGLSPLIVLKDIIEQYLAIKELQNSLLQNGMRPSGAFVTQDPLTEEQYQRLKAELYRYTGPANAGRPLILEGGLDWKPLSMSPQEFDWVTAEKLILRAIAVTLGVAPELIGEPEFKTYSNFQEANRQFYMNTVVPLAELILEEFNRALEPTFKYRIAIDYDSIDALQEEYSEVWKRAIEGVKAGILTPNEARAMLGYEPVKGGDYTLVSANLVPMGVDLDED